MREGEKLSEDLWNDDRKLSGTEHPEISREEGQVELQGTKLENAVSQLIEFSNKGQAKEIIHSLNNIIPNAEIKHIKTEILSIFDL